MNSYAGGDLDKIDSLKYQEDITGAFIKDDKGWTIRATFNRTDRLCLPYNNGN
ncbi:MAG: hypothetical protein LBJ73_03435 [Rickettsiales bacterium]|nr:hypothetical protein [Rickettsiales bacterium]